ncbi:uncharacterized protein UHO2_00349 [Ustilago hordei]|uniref:uncharacterized protein n=1 Tax=Ustilago hordei TaxID=120017 RepID=UPI001A5B5F75|nr:uncharacterized protein UHO2_00349 [Ustilago hordei]SYW81844.1 uncharacterized protein UHO2_00349 [Ustilago hordei]
MIECVSELYYGMHNLGLFPNQAELGRQMQIRVNQFVINKEWNAAWILNFKVEGSMGSVHDAEQHHYPVKDEPPMSSRGNTPTFASNDFGHRLLGCDATPGPTPELNTVANCQRSHA